MNWQEILTILVPLATFLGFILKQMNRKFDELSKRFDKMDARFDKVEEKLQILDSRISRIEGQLSSPVYFEPKVKEK